MGALLLGREEWVAMPELGLPAVLAKTDTGARTSALHATAIEQFGPIKKPLVRFIVQPWPERPEVEIVCAAPLVQRRDVTSSFGEVELRPIIRTTLNIGARTREIEVSLTNRETLRYRMLLGRQALEDAQIDPAQSCLQTPLSYDVYAKAAREAVWRPLRLALLTQDKGNYSCRRLIEAAERAGHVIEALETRKCVLSMKDARPDILYEGKALPRFDAVIPRVGANITAYGCAVLRHFAMTGAYCLNGAEAIATSRDKLCAHQILARAGLPTPATASASASSAAEELIAAVGGAPVVVKLLQASQGRGVVLAETEAAARSVISAFQDLDATFLVQEFIAEAGGADTRIIVLGGKVIAAMRRQAKLGDFRSNLHRGGVAEAVRPGREVREIALRAARLMDLGFAGVDVLISNKGPLVLEVNSSPGLQGIEKTTGVDIAAAVISQIEHRLQPALARKKPTTVL
jgi:ribosomal protein S6--L-glutamate ligase